MNSSGRNVFWTEKEKISSVLVDICDVTAESRNSEAVVTNQREGRRVSVGANSPTVQDVFPWIPLESCIVTKNERNQQAVFSIVGA
jgi:hypothetical protein